MQYEVLYHRGTTWQVGETKAEREQRVLDHTPVAVEDRYPETYPGRVISVRAVRDVGQGRLPSLRKMQSRDWGVVLLDLDRDGREALSSRTSKIVDGRSASVTFDDRQGALAATLRNQFADPEAAEAKAEDFFDVDGRLFVEISAIARSALAPTDTHTGTGLYFTKETPTQLDRTQSGAPAGQVITFTAGGLGVADAFIGGYITNVTRSETRAIVSHIDDAATLEGSLTNWLDTDDLDIFDAWSTVQAALDQLFTDQGATTFSSSQYIRVFAGTYDENVVITASFVTSGTGELLIIEGDPTDSRSNIVIAPSAGTRTIAGNGDRYVFRNLTVAGSPSTELYFDASIGAFIDDCVFSGPAISRAIRINGSVARIRVRNTTITGAFTTAGISQDDFRGSVSLEHCQLKGGGSGVGVISQKLSIQGCSFADWASAIRIGQAQIVGTGIEILQNLTIYNCTNGILFDSSDAIMNLRAINIIFSEVDYPFRFNSTAIWPEESSTRFGLFMTLRNNIFHNYISIAYDGTTNKTLAQLEAFNGVDSSGNLDATDPLMADPGADDFSLDSGSPAIFAGHGSITITGINGVAFDPNTPDIGSWSSGVVPAPTTENPIITAISPNFDGDSFDMTVSQAVGLTVNVYTSPDIPATFSLEPTTRFGDGDLTITGKTANTLYYVYCVTLDGATLIGVSNIVSVFITTTDSGGLPEEVDEDISLLPGVDLLIRDDTHDLARNARDLVLVDGSALVKQNLDVGLQLFKGEWFLDAEAGVPWLQELLGKGVSTLVIDAALKDKIINTTGVNRILTYSSEIDAEARTVSVAFTVDTVYGPVNFEGALL